MFNEEFIDKEHVYFDLSIWKMLMSSIEEDVHHDDHRQMLMDDDNNSN